MSARGALVRSCAAMLLIGTLVSTATRVASSDGSSPQTYSPISRAALATTAGFVFPRDDAAHAHALVELWRVFGFLRGPAGRPIDVTATFFRYAGMRDAGLLNGSAWSKPEVIGATFGIADRRSFRFLSRSRNERAALGLAMADNSHLKISAGAWRLEGSSASEWRARRYTLTLARDGLGASLSLQPLRAPVALGERGVERTGTCPACAMSAYAYTRLSARGNVEIDGATLPVAGTMWLDHAYGDRLYGPGDAGGVRIAVHFEDGRDALFEGAHPARGAPQSLSATVVHRDGSVRSYASDDFRLNPVASHISPANTHYPAGWIVSLAAEDLDLLITPGPRDAEIAGAPGAPLVFDGGADVGRNDPPDGDHGRAFIEMTGYDRPLGT